MALAALALTTVVFLLYVDCLRAPFLFDDVGAVTGNLSIRRLFSWDILRPPVGATVSGRPIANASLAINYAISGDQTWSYHAVNIALHALCALLIFGIVRRTLSPPGAERPGGPSRRWDPIWFAFAVSLLWAVHPLQTETVVNTAQRPEALCVFFYLLTLYAFIRGAELDSAEEPALPVPEMPAPVAAGARAAGSVRAESSGELPVASAAETGTKAPVSIVATELAQPKRPRAASGWFFVAWLACLFGMGSKEGMITAPIAVLLYDRTWGAGSFRAAWRRRGGVYVALGATWSLLLALVWRGTELRHPLSATKSSEYHYLLTEAGVLLLYLKQAIWPHPLVLDYGARIVTSIAQAWWQVLATLVIVAFSGWALVRRPRLGFLLVTFLVLLAPTAAFAPLITHPMAEHRLYLPLLLLVLLGFVGVAYGRLGTAGFLIATWALAAVTVARVHLYRDPLALWTANVRDRPDSVRAHHHRALLLAEKGNVAAASAEYARAAALDPSDFATRYDWGSLLFDRADYPGAIEQLKAAVALAPDFFAARVKLATALVRSGRPAEAVAHYATALRLRPSADLHYDLGVALLNVGNTRDAVEQFNGALAERPDLVDAHYQLAVAAAKEGDAGAELRELRETVRYAPTNVVALRRLGILEAKSGNMTAAADYLRTVVGLDPADFDSLSNLGNVLLVDGRVNEAIGCYQLALRIRPDDAKLKESLEIAQAALDQAANPPAK